MASSSAFSTVYCFSPVVVREVWLLVFKQRVLLQFLEEHLHSLLKLRVMDGPRPSLRSGSYSTSMSGGTP